MTTQVRALLQAEIGRSGVRSFPVQLVEAFQIDSSMDTDADAFSIDIGAPTPELKFLTNRNNEVRCSIFTDIGRGEVQHLQTGIADIVEYSSDDHVLSVNGRDISCVAVDSQAPPGEKKHVRPHLFIGKEARELGISRMKLAPVNKVTKFYRDGSETYWESWYRLYRKRKMWIWTEPDGTLIADKLHYTNSPTYFLGAPVPGRSGLGWIPVERVGIVSDKQKRIQEVWVYGERGDIGFRAEARDNTLRNWKRRPLRILTSSDASSRQAATQEAWEEIFESKVGALEIVVQIPHTGHVLRQNNMAEVNVPEMGLHGIFFVVGVEFSGGPDGYRQVIRLREKNYAISRRVPDDPELEADPGSDTALVGDVGAALRQSGVRWANSFASAAREFRDGWPFDLFLGVLLAICEKESSFRNVREGQSDIEWFPRPTSGGTRIPGTGAPVPVTIDQWKRLFANQAGTPGNPFGREAGVGPMQLTTRGFKVWADEYGGKHDEYEGGRWIPQANIRAGARVFASKLAGLDPGNPNMIWEGVYRYNGSGSRARAYAADVKKMYEDKYSGITEGITETAESLKTGTTTNVTVKDANGRDFTVRIPTNAPEKVKRFVNFLLRQIGKPYQWGAEGPNSFDCSGIVFAGLRAAGVSGGRGTTYTYVRQGLAISKDLLRAGDLVFFARGGDVHHMGIYLNDGHFIHAPSTGDVVKISPLNSPYYRAEYHTARRIISWGGRGQLPSED